jgi:hypothetical protein
MMERAIGYSRAVMCVLSRYDKTGSTCFKPSTHSHRGLRTLLIPSKHAHCPLPLHTIAETPSPRMFWVSLQNPYPVIPCYKYLTAARTDRVIRLPSPLGWASDHRHSQAESGFRTDHHSRINLQRDKRYRVHVRVSRATKLFPSSITFH